MKRRKDLGTMTIRQLVKLYHAAPGTDDFVGPEIGNRGSQARDELIEILDATPAAELDGETAQTIVTILVHQFPSTESTAALERLQSRRKTPPRGSGDLLRLTMLRAEMSGQLNDEWQKEHLTKSPWEADLHSRELLAASARPADRILFLVDLINAALGAYQAAIRAKDSLLQERNTAKVEEAAREMLAIPDLAARSGDGVYVANHALGVLALDRGEVEAAKHYLIRASKTPGSWMLNRVPGPDWGLAIALLRRGECEVVCEFLDNVKVFSKWEPVPTPTRKDALIERWKEIIRAGGTPDFIVEWFNWKAPRKKRLPGTIRGKGSSQEK